MKPTTTAEYERQREHIITLLNTVFGPDAVMPLSEIAPLLPINPEWARYCPKRRALRGGQ